MTAVVQASTLRPGPLVSLWRYRDLIWRLGYREIIGQYKGSYLGVFWSLANPLLLLAVYTFVFTKVFKARWIEGETTAEFATALFVGLIVHGFFAECLNRAPGLVVGNPSYVTKVVFPLEILPYPLTIAALFHAFASLVILLVARLLLTGTLPWTVVLFPIVFAPLVLMAIGFVWVLSALAVFVRDVSQTIAIITTALLFLSPVFYPLQSLPAYMQNAARFNPLTIPIEEARKVLLWGQMPDWMALAGYTAVALLLCAVAFGLFQHSRKGFADVL